MNVVALAGLSGVGKSTFLESLSKRCSFHHYVASEIIKAELARSDVHFASSEELRLGPVIHNQRLLIKGFLRRAQTSTLPIVLDGHVVIDGKSGLIPLPAYVFKEIGTRHLVFLQDEPSNIWVRRKNDKTRARPLRTQENLLEQQDFAIKVAAQISRELSIDMLILTPVIVEPFLQLIQGH